MQLMKVHKNARLTPKGRLQLVRDIDGGMTIVAAAALHRVSKPTAAKWFSRYKTQGEAGLLDRSSRPHALRALTPDEVLRRIETLRRSRMTMDRIAALVGVSSATVSRALKRAGLSRLSDLDP